LQLDTKLVTGKLHSTQRAFSSHDSSSASEEQLRQLETRVMTKMAESVEELATIIKDYAKKNRKMADRVGDLEQRLFGQVREGTTTKLQGSKRLP
jgi:uncharacterized membrane-anchored protein YhcB (DUF1043 family)